MKKPVYIPIETLFDNTFECNLNVRKGDTLNITFKVFEKSVLKDLTGQTVTIILKKSNGTIVEKTITSFSSTGTFTVLFDSLATNVEGLVRGIIEISDENGQSTTNMFTYKVKESFATDIINAATQDIITLGQLQEIIRHAEEIIDRYQAAIDAVAGAGEQVAQLEAVKSFIENTLERLIEENAKALVNADTLDEKNQLAVNNTTLLNVQNDRAEDLLPQITSKNDTAAENIQLLDEKNNKASEHITTIEEKIVEMHNIETTVIQENETASQNIAELIKQNAKAEINIAELDKRNALALEHETTLDDKISTADNKAGILDEKFAIADDKTTLLQSTIDNAVQTKTDLDALNEDAKNTKAELDEANAFATEQIDIIKSFDASTTVQDVNDLKAEVHKARSTFSDLDARITEAEGSGGFFMNDTLPDISNRKSGILYMQIL